MASNSVSFRVLLSAACVGLVSGCQMAGFGYRDHEPVYVDRATTVDSADPSVQAAVDAGLFRLPETEPKFTTPSTGVPTVGDGDRPARFVGAMNIYGEMPGSPSELPADALENLQQVSFTHEGADFDVDIDTAGEWLVFASTQHRPTSDIYLKRTTGTSVTQLTSDPANDTMPTFSPAGDMVAYCSDRTGNWDIYIKNLQGGKPIQVTNSPAHELHPSWSPDGKQLIFSSLGETSGQWEMVIVDVENPASRRFIGFGLFPEFSPAGNQVVFQRPRFRGTRWFSIWTMDIVNGEGKRPTEIAVSSNAAVITPTWSPDGRRIAFATVMTPNENDANTRPRKADLWLINVDGTGRVKLTNDTFVNLQPTWGDDGRIYFVSNRSGVDNLWAVKAESNTITAEGPQEDSTASVPVE